jgi:hypothetical protein
VRSAVALWRSKRIASYSCSALFEELFSRLREKKKPHRADRLGRVEKIGRAEDAEL